jgi:ABC-2 type transport system permease protein
MNIIKNGLGDAAVMTGRCMRHSLRSVDTIITVVIMPVMMMLMTVYVFGGAMNTGSESYINFVAPGIVLMGIVSGAAYTAFRLNTDITRGVIDRFRSMPITKSSILGGHVITSVIFNVISTVIIMLIAFALGFSSGAGFLDWLVAAGILVLFMLAMTWTSVFFGVLAKSPEGAGVFSYILMFMLFISSGFAPPSTMPGAVRAFAENQLITPVINTIRALLSNQPVSSDIWVALAWCLGITVVAYIFAMRAYKRKTA